MSEVAESHPAKPAAAAAQPPTDSEGHPVREWIDTLLQAAVIAKDKQKKPADGDDKTPATATDTSANGGADTAADASTEVKDATATDATSSDPNKEADEKDKPSPTPEAKDESMEPVVDIACKERSSGCYHGNEQGRQSVQLKFGDFVDYYQAAFRKQSHWLQEVDDLEFYLAQCPIAVFKPGSTCAKASLPAIMNDFRLPGSIQDKPISQVNLWMTVQPGRTTLHYDAYQNILAVLYGKKTVTLYPPSDAAKLYPFPVHTKSVNHSRVNIVEPDLKAHPRFPEASAYRFEVTSGDAIVIPEGWWHQVDSDTFTIAVNYWWDGEREKLVADKRMVSYYARVMLEELVKQQCESQLFALRSSSETAEATLMDEASAVAAIIAEKAQFAREKMLLSLDNDVFMKTQRLLATSHAADWRGLLANASVGFVAVLTKCWEDDNLEPDLLEVLFGSLGKEEEVLKKQLLTKQAQFRQNCAAEMYQSLFC
ncbi:Clavaminate synthase-like protein [Phytophthora cinnamomi]|uniref:Clavaminate synthase-like protein n=1 Tax=Phytophthora cinnamomi TaxID=4785 RepID=UPI00355A9FCC|nr:Clavaminate synthase-like protein [Phytophthora cinnamomi]